MARKKLIEHNALLQAIEMGTPKKELQERFGFKTNSALKTAYYNALVALDKIPEVKDSNKKKKIDTKISVNSRGSLVIPKNLVDQLDIAAEDVFDVVKNGSDLMLKKLKKPPKTILRKKAHHTPDRQDFNPAGLPN